jgi:alkylation response protein AidB-like acyl-CoA dehydrogenase
MSRDHGPATSESPVAEAPELADFAEQVRAWLLANAAVLEEFRKPLPGPIEESFAHERRFHNLLFDSGLARWGWPVGAGGFGGDPLLRAVLHEELYAAGYGLPEAFIGLEVVAPTIVRYAPEIAAAHLPAKLRGDEEWCQGFSEPDAGSDLASLRTRAVPDGDGFRLQGRKLWTSYGHLARWCLLLARTGTPESRHRGLSLFWLDLLSEGVEVRPLACASGRNEVSELLLDDVAIPSESVIGGLGGGWEAVMYLMQFERGNFAWGRQAWLHWRLGAALEAVGAHASPSATTAVGAAYLDLCALREASLAAVTQLAAGENLGPQISVVKILLAGAEQAVFEAVRRLSPGDFLLSDDGLWELSRQQWWFSRIVSIYGGAGEVQRDLVSERLLGLPRGH